MASGDAASARPNEMPADLSPRHLGRRLLELALFGGAIAILVKALPGLGSLRARFAHVDPADIALILMLELASCLSYVAAFRGVFCQRLSWRFSYELGMAEQATNVLLPTGGAGGLALGAWALRQGGMPTEYIGRRSVAFFVITSSINFFCAALFGVLLLTGALPGDAPIVPTVVFTVGAFAAISLVALLPWLLRGVRPSGDGGRVRRAVRASALALANGVRDTGSLLRSRAPLAIGGSIGYMGFDVAALAAAFAAFGAVPPFGPFVFAYVVGQLGGLIPLPGGIGGTDGGLIGALVLYGVPLPQAAAAVLVYRAFQLGLPSLLGAVAFLQLRRVLGSAEQPAAMCAPLAEPIAPLEPRRAAA
jgi:uncharacterized membrane protein YbhN (UPF0104 family)